MSKNQFITVVLLLLFNTSCKKSNEGRVRQEFNPSLEISEVGKIGNVNNKSLLSFTGTVQELEAPPPNENTSVGVLLVEKTGSGIGEEELKAIGEKIRNAPESKGKFAPLPSNEGIIYGFEARDISESGDISTVALDEGGLTKGATDYMVWWWAKNTETKDIYFSEPKEIEIPLPTDNTIEIKMSTADATIEFLEQPDKQNQSKLSFLGSIKNYKPTDTSKVGLVLVKRDTSPFKNVSKQLFEGIPDDDSLDKYFSGDVIIYTDTEGSIDINNPVYKKEIFTDFNSLLDLDKKYDVYLWLRDDATTLFHSESILLNTTKIPTIPIG